jgi:hypothetical protein
MTDNPYHSPGPEHQPASVGAPLVPSVVAANAALVQKSAVLLQRFKNGASWFYWLAALSIINSLLSVFEANVRFIFGLTITQVFDGEAKGFQQQGFETAIWIALGLDFLAAGFFVLVGTLALRGMHFMFIIGLVVYFLDALLALGLLWLGVISPLALLFHAFVIWQIWNGWRAHRQLDALADAAVAHRPA